MTGRGTTRGRGNNGRGRPSGRGRGGFSSNNEGRHPSSNRTSSAAICERILQRIEALEVARGLPAPTTRKPGTDYRERYNPTYRDNARLPDKHPPSTSTRDKPSTGSAELPSNNKDFAEFVRKSHRYVQLAHHTQNWTSCPSSIAFQTDRLVNNIKPPMPSDALTDSLSELAGTFKSAITALVTTHLHRRSQEVLNDLSKLDRSDEDKVQIVVKRQLYRRMGKRLQRNTLNAALAEIQDISYPPNPAAVITPIVHLPTVQTPPTSPAVNQDQAYVPSVNPPNLGTPEAPMVIHDLTSSPSETQLPDPAEMHLLAALSVLDDEMHMPAPSTPRKKQRLGSVEKAPPKPETPQSASSTPNRSTSSTNRTLVVRHLAPEKWTIPQLADEIHTFVICDQNGASWKPRFLPSCWTSVAYFGAHLADVPQLIQNNESALKNVKTIIISVGVNDSQTKSEEMVVDLNWLTQWAIRKDKNIVMAPTPLLPTFSKTSLSQVQNNNAAMRKIFRQNVTPTVPTQNIVMRPDDPSGCHYDYGTAQMVINSIVHHLQ